MKQYVLEVCANSVESCIIAQEAGANRVELCENLSVGGTTPSYGCIKLSRQKLSIPINILIRPRPGDFLYSSMEFKQIKEDIAIAKELGANGIVCGMLLPNGKIDEERTTELVECSKPLTFTFHRAFDFTPNPIEALETVIKVGSTNLLTSGQHKTAIDGIALLKKLVTLAGNRLNIIAGGGINAQNVEILKGSEIKQFHMSGSVQVKSKMGNFDRNFTLNSTLPDNVIQTSDFESIKNVVLKLG